MPRELLFRVTIKDCDVQTFRTGGHGGQHRDKTSNGVRIVHPPSGGMGQCSDDRSQRVNKREAFVRMAKSEKFEAWRKLEAMRLLGHFPETLAAIVDREMDEANLLVEIHQDGVWRRAE